MDSVKQAFSTKLVDGLKKVYGGRMPAISTVARDFSLKSPHLPHISDETIRKWIRGSCLPHVSRMQVLVEWLGQELTTPFERPVLAYEFSQQKKNHQSAKQANGHINGNGNHNDGHTMHDELIAIVDRLSEKECQSILAIAKLLAEKKN